MKRAVELIGLSSGAMRLPLHLSMKRTALNLKRFFEVWVYCMINAGVTGASGRMGKLIIENILRSEDVCLTAAFDLANIVKM